jgi:DNA polymerase III delta prime subunit
MSSLEEKYQKLVLESLKNNNNNYLLDINKVLCKGNTSQCNKILDENELFELIKNGYVILFPDETIRPIHVEYLYKNAYFAPSPDKVIAVESTILTKEYCRPSFDEVNKNNLQQILEDFFQNEKIAKIFSDSIFSLHFKPKGLSNYQFNYLKDLFADAANIALISSPTGSGKTEIYMLYVVAAILKNKLRNNEKGVKFIIIYPRKALERDQLERFIEFLYNINKLLEYNNLGDLKVTIGILDGDSIDKKDKIPKNGYFRQIQCGVCRASKQQDNSLLKYSNKIIECEKGHKFDFVTDIKEQISENPPDILITNFSMLNRILPDCNYRGLISGSLKGVVIDEAHTIRDVEGAYNMLTLFRILLRYLIVKNNGNIGDINFAQLNNLKLLLSSATISTASSEIDRRKDMESFIKYILGNTYNLLGGKFIYYDFDKLNSGSSGCLHGKRLLILQSLVVNPKRGIETLAQTILVNTLLFSYFTGKKFIAFADSKEAVERLYRFTNINIKERDEILDHFCAKDFKTMLGLWQLYCDGISKMNLNDLLKDGILGYSYLYGKLISSYIEKYKISDLNTLLNFIKNNQNKIKDDLINKAETDLININNEIKKIYDFEHAEQNREVRTEKENKLKNGDLMGLISTSTLELGIDIGDLNVILQYKPPKKSESFIQRIGRGGRSRDTMFTSVGVLLLGNLDYIYAVRDYMETLLFNVRPSKLPISNRKFWENVVYKTIFDIIGYKCLINSLFITCDINNIINISNNIINYINENKELIKSIIKSSMLEMMYEESVHNIEVIDYVIDKLVKNLSLLKSIKDSSNVDSSNNISEIIKNINEVVDMVRNVRNVDRESKDLEKLYSNMWLLEGIEKDLENLQNELYLTEEDMKKIKFLKEIISNLKERISEIEELIRNENINKILRENIELDELEKHLALIKKNIESLEKSAENYNLYSIVSKYYRICGEGL